MRQGSVHSVTEPRIITVFGTIIIDLRHKHANFLDHKWNK